ncbi:hypothetical protein [Streptomyces palmae]|uniref:Uncharacterized protein n=1 Tax=Streptomyces palmae TaxID=1701085 RepID=A0A4Z0HC37_9ACTN|nr:hypothetical protein [Streptomyces palmae]TGB14092.1 hypothetical protein E4099_08885 [Streptomyces palmae]
MTAPPDAASSASPWRHRDVCRWPTGQAATESGCRRSIKRHVMELSPELREQPGKWNVPQAVEEDMDPQTYYDCVLSSAPGRKVGGWGPTDPTPRPCPAYGSTPFTPRPTPGNWSAE